MAQAVLAMVAVLGTRPPSLLSFCCCSSEPSLPKAEPAMPLLTLHAPHEHDGPGNVQARHLWHVALCPQTSEREPIQAAAPRLLHRRNCTSPQPSSRIDSWGIMQ